MKKLLLATAASATLLMVGGQASAAVFPLTVITGSNDFGNTLLASGSFDDHFTFTVPGPSTGTSFVGTVSLKVRGQIKQDIDFSSVDLDGTPFTGVITPFAGNPDGKEDYSLDIPVLGAGPHTINVYGTSNATLTNSASYAGTLNIASAVPEPATWAMMIAGFGLVGGAMRRRNTVRTVFA